jgi:L-sorbose 1-phosphate reductase
MEFLETMPQEILSWQLKGSGLESIGTKGRPDTVPFPSWTEENLVARVDACGLCFSDIKLISSGNAHPRIEGRDLAKNPTVPGHEVTMTIVGVGDKWKGKFRLGDRYIIQADVYYKGKGVAFGYAIPGGLSQYVVLGTEILEGDEGCYLLPVKNSTGFAEAALVEPWTCVIAAYQIHARTRPREKGHLHVEGFPRGQVALRWNGLEGSHFSLVTWRGLSAENVSALTSFAQSVGAPVAERDARPAGSHAGPADIVITGTPDREAFGRLATDIDADGVLGVHTTEPEVEYPVDVGKVHYRRMELVGSTDGAVAASYARNTREKIIKGGKAWFVGGAGPMGQMHVIKAVMDDDGPNEILVTDLSDERLASLEHLVNMLCENRACRREITFKNPKDLPADELDTFLHEKFPGGFDDVVVLVPVSAIISQAAHYLAPGGVLNIFAGVKLGTITDLPFAPIVRGRMRVVGSSGSPLSAMRDTLSLSETGGLSTSYSLAAVGDMGAAAKGLKALMDNTYTGKVVIFPFAHGIGLKSLKELARDLPELSSKLLDGQYWTRDAEDAFRKSRHFG